MAYRISTSLPKIIEEKIKQEMKETGLTGAEISRDSLRKRYKIKKK